jgi:two-component system NtrC family sensor kinase
LSRPLRLSVFDRGAEAADWDSLMGSHSLEVLRAETLADALAEPADYVLLRVESEQLPDLATELGTTSDPSPLAILINPARQVHPLVRLLRTLLSGKREWEATFDAIVDPLALLDSEGRVVRANLGFATLVARDIKELAGVAYATLLGSVSAGSLDPIAASLADGEPHTQESRFGLLSGVQLVTTSPLRGPDGASNGVAVLLKDLSGQKEEQERLSQAVRLADIGQLAAGVAHEINTPLASIALRAESLLKKAEDPRLRAIEAFQNFPRYLKTIEEETYRCKKIIGALLEFSSSRKRDARPVDLSALAERAADLVGHQMKLKQVQLDLHLDPGLPALPADDGQLRQVLIALLMNALDATPSGGHVVVSTRLASPGRVALEVADDGAGIPADLLDKIFTPFFTTKPVGKGTGLGLAICHGIVSAHGGDIHVESEPGHGARFTVVLPVEAPATA